MFIPKTEEAGGFSQLRIEDGIRTRRTRKDVADETVGRTGEIGYRRTYRQPLHLKCVVLIIHEGNGDWLKRCTGNGGKLNYRLQVPS